MLTIRMPKMAAPRRTSITRRRSRGSMGPRTVGMSATPYRVCRYGTIGPTMRDQFGRPLTDLRVSLTDRCNLRCVYCMPEDGIAFRPPDELLQDDELVMLVEIAAELGVQKI